MKAFGFSLEKDNEGGLVLNCNTQSSGTFIPCSLASGVLLFSVLSEVGGRTMEEFSNGD